MDSKTTGPGLLLSFCSKRLAVLCEFLCFTRRITNVVSELARLRARVLQQSALVSLSRTVQNFIVRPHFLSPLFTLLFL